MSRLKTHQNPEQTNLFEEAASTTLKPLEFTTNYAAILEKIENINPNSYAKSRNFITGAVTYLSPYIARGVIGLPQIKNAILSKYKFYEAEKLLQELAWREYFQRQWQYYGDKIFTDVKQPQQGFRHQQIPTAILNATTTIDGIDTAIQTLYETGYMHNHCRMYTAMLACNVAKAHWLQPAKWLYYHLLDGDLASNHLSWQWVAGSFSSKKYFANQENISRYTNSNQTKGYLANSYDMIAQMDVPEILQPTTNLQLTTTLPTAENIILNPNEKLLVYNSYNIDPHWYSGEITNRILLLEPSHFNKYPVSDNVLNFIIKLAKDNIPTIQIFVGEFSELMALFNSVSVVNTIYFKEHPTAKHYRGIEESRDWLFPFVQGYFSSFFGYWKKVEKNL
ncbi:MAG: deoxyribodipyrimidine photolyase [Pedobacter sp.]|nr:deoxyribodipyrimidine photolyase [Chitinophagaceae bacterium]